jgi:hypothetical protein
MTRINRQKIFGSMSYKIKEMSDCLDISEKTCLRWIENGLSIVPGGKKPILILGSEIKNFLRKKDSKKKIKLKRSEFYCLTCKAARNAKQGSIKKLQGHKTALCRVCGGKMSRIFKSAQKDYMIPPLPTQMSIFDVIPTNQQNDKIIIKNNLN